ncbi:hypothetical protein Ahy_B02g058141 isoform F [Arachis hypogaea]|uniref:AAA+ ATPase domain-containing protein n=1 Tax=Arachis hypogaea TaxID=3818 RepID=A0A445ADY0_ARAHY|nr:hypothetical protein Ahy_B02g058141 isoform F [Arachis hypogaea]
MAAFIPIPDFLQQRLIDAAIDFVKNQCDYVWDYETRFEELSNAAETLKKDKTWVQDKAEEEEGRYGRAIYDYVHKWLAQVEDVVAEYDKFQREHERNDGYPLAIPNVQKRHHRSKIAEEMKVKVEEVKKDKPDGISHWQGPLSMGFALPSVDYEELQSRVETMHEITKALEDSSATMIGIHGLAGMGKTTLVIEAANRVQNRESKLFDVVIMANVGKILDIRKTQGQIADMLGITLQEESEYARAIRIKEKLKKEKNALIILDDVYAKVDLDMLGIPSQSADDKQKNLLLKEGKSFGNVDQTKAETNQTDGPSFMKQNTLSEDAKTEDTSIGSSKLKAEENYKGCKVLLISEVKQVLSQMDVKPNYMFLVNTINVDDAKKLFMKKVRIDYKNSELEYLAAEIAKKCYGLPMSIVTTAKALKNQNHLVWRETLKTLERQKLTGTPEYSTKLSYQLLENEELKFTFLLCACMGQDALVSDFVRLCIGIGFLEGIYTVREARDKVQILLMKLKESGLLSNSYSISRFAMQNLVRDAALLTASEEKQIFMLTKCKLDEWPDEDKLEKYTAIFLRQCDVNTAEFPGNIRCPKLKVFHFDNNHHHFKIPGNFFQEMKELRVLILIGVDISELSSSIKCLRKLRKLCLEQCINLDDQLCINIGELKNLRILSFSGSDIKSLPVALMQLSKLQILDISNCSKLEVIPPGLISNLTSLEELYMSNISTEWESHDNASLSELGNLNLSNIDLQIPSVDRLPKDLFFNNLHSYKIVIGSSNRHLEPELNVPEKYELLRYLAIREKDGAFDIHSQKGIKMLFERVENLLLEELNGVQDIFFELNLNGFPFLKQLSIVSNSSILSLINPKERKHPEKAFPKLESLYLYKLKNMVQICSCKSLSESSFCKLKAVKVKLCDGLKNVFFASMAKLLVALETIEVSECNSLEGVFFAEAEDADTSKPLEFQMLRSLTLQSLPKFLGFYLTSSSAVEEKVLFNEKVKFSKLEKIELLSIQIHQIWIGQKPPFAELVHLEVKGCGNLEFLLSLSMARNMVKLQSLSVTECHKMKLIFSKEQGSTDVKKKERIFPNLKNIKVSNMKSLSEICDFEFPVNSFVKLETAVIDKCDKLNHVFTHDMVGIFEHLCSLRVTNCKSIKAIFNLDGRSKLSGTSRYAIIKLQDVHLQALPKLEHLFNRKKDHPEGNFGLKNLQKIWVQECGKLENIFSVPIAKTSENLEYLVVSDCSQLREIVADEEVANNPSDLLIKFTKLATIKFLRLPKLKRFCRRDYDLELPALNDLSIELCDKLEPHFKRDTTDAQRKPIYFFEEALNELKSLQIGSWHAKLLSNYDSRMDKLEELHLSGLKNTNILYVFLHNNPNLISLWLSDCSFQQLVPLERLPNIERLGVVPKLKSLNLIDLPNLKEIGFERDAILQMITLAPSSVFLAHLTKLEVVGCKGLKYLMSPSMARALSQLNTMKVINCESLMEIVSDEGQQQKEDGVIVAFKQLTTLELVALKNLQSFCSFNKCSFQFPSLEKFVVNVCPKLENFTQGISNMPMLQKVYVAHEKEQMRWHWKGNLQDTMQYIFKHKKFYECMDELRVTDKHDYRTISKISEGLQEDWFNNLKTLKLLQCCGSKPYAIPSNVLLSLKILEELEVEKCSKIISIFEVDNSKIKETSFQLKKLTLKSLTKVTHVWQHNKQGILGFQNLQQVRIFMCNKLKTVFPVALARNLKKLEKLNVLVCTNLLEIVRKEEEAIEITENFLFPCLTQLLLGMLSRLTHFCSGKFTVVCPELNELRVLGCSDELELFQSHQQRLQDQSSTSIISRQPVFTNKEAISNVKTLYLNQNQILALSSWLAQSVNQGLQYLIELGVVNFAEVKNNDDGENSALLLEILDKTPNLERFEIRNHHFKSINIPEEAGKRMLGLKELSLLSLSELNTISGVEYLLNLQLLKVSGCPKLTTLGQTCSNLKELDISICHRLDAILKLPSLIWVNIEDCPAMKSFSQQGAVHVEERSRAIQISYDSSNDDFFFHDDLNVAVAMKFLQQEHLVLGDDHPELEVLWLGKMHMPEGYYSGFNLKRLVVEGCEFLTSAILSSHLLPFLNNLEELEVRGCNSVEAIFEVKDTSNMIVIPLKTMILENLPSLRHVWNKDPEGKLSLPDMEKVTVDKCTRIKFLLPESVAKGNIQRLEVKNCAELVEIVTGNEVAKEEDANKQVNIFPKLSCLNLCNLPNLSYIWKIGNKDLKGSLSLPNLKEVTVIECESIKNLLPTSVAMGSIQKLDVRNCVELVEIVAKDEAATKKTNKELTMFSMLMSLTLRNLPNLTHIYVGKKILNWPELRELDIYHCKLLKNFAPDSNHSAGKVVSPGLEQLSLDKEGVMMIEQGLSNLDLQNIRCLTLQGFNDIDESDAFPFEFFSKVPLPRIEMLAVADSAFKEIFSSKLPDTENYAKILSQLKKLELRNLQKLESTGLDLLHTWVASSNLTWLKVECCASFKCLFTSSTAKCLVQLQHLHVSNCEALESVIVAYQPDDDEVITFEGLKELSLSKLPKLESFYNGKSTLNFAGRAQVSISQCKSMKTFSHGDVKAPDSWIVEIDGVRFSEDNPNAIEKKEKDIFLFLFLFCLCCVLCMNKFSVLLCRKKCRTPFKWNSSKCEVIPPGLISNLTSLEELYMSNISTEWESHDNASLSELENLNLSNIDLQIPSVKFSKLEKIELSSIQIHQLWIGQKPPFAELVHLEVKGCGNLEFLLSLSMARNMVKLQSLSITECDKMKLIFSKDKGSTDVKKKETIFPNLKNIKVSNMKSLSEICDFEFPVDSFVKLETAVINECGKLNHVFTHDMVGIFEHLSSLRVTNCKSIKAIFNLDGKNKLAGTSRYATIKLQDVHLQTLPKLEHLFNWKKDRPEGNFNLKNLQKIWVQECGRLENIFSFHVAKTIEDNLEYLVVSDCSQLREIVAEEEDANNPSNTIEFTKLATVKFLRLPKFKRFCRRDYELKLPALNDLSIEICDKLEPHFKRDTTDAQRKPMYFFEELKSLQIGSQHAKLLSNYDSRMDKLEELHFSQLDSTDVLYAFLHSNPNLMSLWLNRCYFQKLVPLERPPNIERLGVVPKLKGLNLMDLPYLEGIGFERDAILQMIESLTLKDCPRLETLAPSSVCLSHLTKLEVVGCKGLKYLISPSTARRLGQLNTMKIINCQSLVEIVSCDRENLGEVDLIFEQLTTLELVALDSLQSFCSFKSCSFHFPILEKFVMNVCPKLENFSQGVSNTPILQKVYLDDDKEKMRWYWKENLQDTIQYIFKHNDFFECMEELSVIEHLDYLEPFWESNKSLQEDLFDNLKTLKLQRCDFKSYAIPSNVLLSLKILEELEVDQCSTIQTIFEMDNTKIKETSFQLKKLTLTGLQNVTHVWQHEKQGILGFQNLQQVTILGCGELKAVFPLSLARNLKKLEELAVAQCEGLLEIVRKEEEAMERTENFEFPNLTTLALCLLPRFSYFYSGNFTLECPDLNELQVFGCSDELELLHSHQQQLLENPSRRQPLFTNKDAIFKVEKLMLNKNHTLELSSWLGQSMNQGLPCLNELNLVDFDEEKNNDVRENSTTPLEILDKTPNLEIIEIYGNHCKTINIPEAAKRILDLKELKLWSLSELNSISGLEYLLKLRLLQVYECPKLTTLGQSCSNLKELHIEGCHGLQCLFTSSSAKMLIQLQELKVLYCDSLKEIVGKEQQSDETATVSAVEFKRLERISLLSLERLECFYSENGMLKLPSLISVEIEQCPRMKIFSQTAIHVEPSRPIQVSYTSSNDDLLFCDDLNVAVAWKSLQQEYHLILRNHPELKDLWLGKMHFPEVSYSSFDYLKLLEVEGCEFLTTAIPSHLFPLLGGLNTLKVRECNSVETIFEVKDTPNMIVIPLFTMTLEKLPTLRHVWNKDPEGKLSHPDIMKIIVDECKSIRFLLPESVAKGDIERLEVKNCAELVEIVTGDELGVNKQVSMNMFPNLSSLTLWNLPNLNFLYHGRQEREFSSSNALLPWHLLPCLHKLEELVVGKCGSFETIFDVEDAPKNDENANMITVIPLKKLTLEHLPALRKVWNKDPKGSVSLPCLEEVVVIDCKSIKNLLPISVSMGSIQKLDVRNCEELVEIVANNEAATEETNKELSMFPTLTSLTLQDLPDLTHIYAGMQILNWPELRELDVYHCKLLKKFAPDSIASAGKKEREEKRKEGRWRRWASLPPSPPWCHREEGQNRGTERAAQGGGVTVAVVTVEVFIIAVYGDFWDYRQLHFVATPVQILRSFVLFYFNPPYLEFDILGLVSSDVTPHLERLSLDMEGVKMLEKVLLHLDNQNIKYLKLQGFDDIDESDAFPLEFFSKVPLPNIEMLAVVDSAFKEIFPSKLPDTENYAKILSRLKKLELRNLHKLESTGLELLTWVASSNLAWLEVECCASLKLLFTSSTAKYLVQLQHLYISNCEALQSVIVAYQLHDDDDVITFQELKELSLSKLPKLENFYTGKSTLNFPVLKDVMVTECNRMEHLFTFSTAKSLKLLNKMEISKCESLKSIVVATEEVDKPRENLAFPNLEKLSLSQLPKLESFFAGNSTLKIQKNWVEVWISECSSMKTFSQGDVELPNHQNLRRVYIDGVRFSEDNLNAIVSQKFENRSKEAALMNVRCVCGF